MTHTKKLNEISRIRNFVNTLGVTIRVYTLFRRCRRPPWWTSRTATRRPGSGRSSQTSQPVSTRKQFNNRLSARLEGIDARDETDIRGGEGRGCVNTKYDAKGRLILHTMAVVQVFKPHLCVSCTFTSLFLFTSCLILYSIWSYRLISPDLLLWAPMCGCSADVGLKQKCLVPFPCEIWSVLAKFHELRFRQHVHVHYPNMYIFAKNFAETIIISKNSNKKLQAVACLCSCLAHIFAKTLWKTNILAKISAETNWMK